MFPFCGPPALAGKDKRSNRISQLYFSPSCELLSFFKYMKIRRYRIKSALAERVASEYSSNGKKKPFEKAMPAKCLERILGTGR